ncbi:MAG: hypothetical protein ACI39N_00405, partial [Lachnospiraceae bacterium]
EYEKNLLDLLKETYYEYHNQKTVLTPISSKSVFKKRVETEYKLINRFGKPCSIRFSVAQYSLTKELDVDKSKDNLQLRIKIDGVDMSKHEIKNHITISRIEDNDKENYDYIINFDYPLDKSKEHKVKMEYEYEVPDYDLTQVYKMTRPCKKFIHEFYMKGDLDNKGKWGLTGNAYTAFFCNQNDPEANYKVEQSIDESITIRFNKWTLPGAGYVILLNRIKNN